MTELRKTIGRGPGRPERFEHFQELVNAAITDADLGPNEVLYALTALLVDAIQSGAVVDAPWRQVVTTAVVESLKAGNTQPLLTLLSDGPTQG